MAKKSIISKTPRKTLADRLREANLSGYEDGKAAGTAAAATLYAPNRDHKEHVVDFVRLIESWGALSEDAVVMFAGTDLRHHAHAAIPLRLLRVVARELKRLGYAPVVQ